MNSQKGHKKRKGENMMGKKDYQLFADAVSQMSVEKGEEFMNYLFPIFRADNSRFDETRFREWVARRKENKSMNGLRFNPK